MQATTFTNSFKIVDMYMATQVPAPAQVILYEEKIARAHEMGENIMKALNTPATERKWLGDPDYDGKVTPGHKIVMVGGGLVGCEAGLYLQKTGHEVTVVELLDRLANESFGMYREALIWEMEKFHMGMMPNTRCLEITPTSVKVENAEGTQTLEADTILYALGMRSVDIAALKTAAEVMGMKTWVIGDAIHPGKVDQATRSAYLAGIEIGK